MVANTTSARNIATNASRRRPASSYVILIFAILGSAGFIILATVVLLLALPGRPPASGSMRFDGFIELPGHGVLTVLDYLVLEKQHLYATSISRGTLFDLTPADAGSTDFTHVDQMAGPGAAHGVALVPLQGIGFITRSKINRVDVFDLKTLKPISQIPVSEDPDAILYIQQEHLVYVANGDAKLATLIDANKHLVVGTIPLSGKPEFMAFDSQTGLLYQNLKDKNTLAAVDLGRHAVVGRWSLSPCEGPSGMAIDPVQRRLFAVCSGNAALVVFNLDTHEVIAKLKVGSLPDSVVYDATLHRLYSAGGTGVLTVIEQDSADRYRVLDQISTHFGAHTLALDAKTHKVYVAYASLFVHPRIAVFSPIVTNVLNETRAP